MALIVFEDCGNSLSHRAEKCIHCGTLVPSNTEAPESQEKKASGNWFNSAAKYAVLNGILLGPLNIMYWFQSGRFENPY